MRVRMEAWDKSIKAAAYGGLLQKDSAPAGRDASRKTRHKRYVPYLGGAIKYTSDRSLAEMFRVST